MKKDYVTPKVELIYLGRNLSMLDYFSGQGDIDQYEDGGDLDGIVEEEIVIPTK